MENRKRVYRTSGGISNMIDMKIPVIWGLIMDDLEHWEKGHWWWCESLPEDDRWVEEDEREKYEVEAWEGLKKRWNDSIKSLLKEYAMEIIGEDERLKKITPKNSMDRVIVQTRNSLRAEQREKVGEI